MNSKATKAILIEVVSVFLLSFLAVNILHFFLPPSLKINESSDYLSVYEPVARNFSSGKGIVYDDGSSALSYPPGYSIFLATAIKTAHFLSVPETHCITQFHFISIALSAVFLFLMALKVWRARISLLVPILWLLYPYTIWHFKQPGSEIPFLAIFYASLLLFVKIVQEKKQAWCFYFLLGALAGCAMLIRPMALGFGIVLGTLFFFIRNDVSVKLKIFLILCLFVGNVAVILPWQMWVYFKTGKIILLAENGISSMRDGLTFAVDSKGYREPILLPSDVEELMGRAMAQSSLITSAEDVVKFSIEELKRNPWTALKFFAIKAARSWYATDSGRYEKASLIIQFFYLGAFLTSLYHLFHNPQTKWFAMSVATIAVYFWAMAILVLPIFRYLFPLSGLLFVTLPALVPKSFDEIQND